MSNNKILHIEDIMNILPHRYPFLLIDRYEVVTSGEKGIGTKNVTMNEEFFQGHFPGAPVMPGVLQVEAMAQTAGILVMEHLNGTSDEKHSVLFMSIEGVKFRKPVKPGDQLKMHLEKIRERHNVYVFKGQSFVDDVLVSEAEFTAMITK